MANRHSTLLLQTVLIVLPILVLSSVALYSLRKDRALIETEARERARTNAPAIARQWGRRLSVALAAFLAEQDPRVSINKNEPAQILRGPGTLATSHDGAEALPQLQCFVINGQVRSPVDFSSLPTPADWPNELTPEQARLWKAAEEAFFQRRNLAAARKTVSALTAAKVPEAVRGNAEFNLLLLESKNLADPKLAERFIDLSRRYPESLSPSGVPLADLSLIESLRHRPASPMPEGFWVEFNSRAIDRPSFLTPRLMEDAERVIRDPQTSQKFQTLKKLWVARRQALGLLHDLLRRSMDMTRPVQVWLESDGRLFLALCSPFSASKPTAGRAGSETACHVTLIPKPLLEQAFLTALAESRHDLPPYASLSVQIANRRWTFSADSRALESPADQTHAKELAFAGAELELQPEIPALSAPGFRRDLERAVPAALSGQQIGTYQTRPSGFSSSHPFRIGLELASPDVLYSGYRQRLWLASGLVLSAVAAALIGLAGAWRAFQRQLLFGEMKSNFVSSVSHELRAPLASVRLMAESLERGKISDETKQREYHRLIVRECRRLTSLIENVLEFSLIDRGLKRYEFEPVNAVALVDETVRSMEPYAAERGVRLVFSDPPPAPTESQPRWDGEAIQEALVNLIDNAIKHSPAQSAIKIGLEIASAADSPTNDGNASTASIRISVEDQGHGIPDKEKEKIFEPFYRRGTELLRETRGIGIGLSIVKHVALAHGGRVLVQSVEGQGSRFILDLPLDAGTREIGNEQQFRENTGGSPTRASRIRCRVHGK